MAIFTESYIDVSKLLFWGEVSGDVDPSRKPRRHSFARQFCFHIVFQTAATALLHSGAVTEVIA